MTKRFCDACGTELTKATQLDTFKIKVPNGEYVMEVRDLEYERPDICLYCVIKALDNLDTRPRPA